jgi:hypothetical protein
MNQTTPDVTVSGDSVTIPLTGLAAATTYYYQIIRGNTGRTSTSTTATFATLGYSVAVNFVDNHDTGIQGIVTSIDDMKTTKKSGNDGTALFNEISSGDHTILYNYKGKDYKKSISLTPETVSPEDAAAAKVVTVEYTINLQALGATAATKTAKKDASWIAYVVPICVVAVAIILGVIGYLRRKRKISYQNHYEDFPQMGLPQYERPAPVMPEPIAPLPDLSTVPRPENAAHLGESLKEMVLRSMAEEAKKREDQGKKD